MRIAALLLTFAALTLTACGSDGSSNSMHVSSGVSDCDSVGFLVHLDGIDCEVVNAMVVLLDGRAKRQSLTLTNDRGNRVTWNCKYRSIVGPMRCSSGDRSFRIEREAD